MGNWELKNLLLKIYVQLLVHSQCNNLCNKTCRDLPKSLVPWYIKEFLKSKAFLSNLIDAELDKLISCKTLVPKKFTRPYLIGGQGSFIILAERYLQILFINTLLHFKYFNKTFFPQLSLPLHLFRNIRGAV